MLHDVSRMPPHAAQLPLPCRFATIAAYAASMIRARRRLLIAAPRLMLPPIFCRFDFTLRYTLPAIYARRFERRFMIAIGILTLAAAAILRCCCRLPATPRLPYCYRRRAQMPPISPPRCCRYVDYAISAITLLLFYALAAADTR